MTDAGIGRASSASIALLCLCASVVSHAAGLTEVESVTLDRIRSTKQVRVGFRSASYPFSFLPSQGNGPEADAPALATGPSVTVERGGEFRVEDWPNLPRGYSIDLCLEIVQELMTELELPRLEIVFVRGDPRTRFKAMSENLIDIECGSTSITISRNGKVDFSHVIFVTGTKLLVRRGLIDEILGVSAAPRVPELEIEDLAGRRIAVPQETTNFDALRAISVGTMVDITLVPVRDHDSGLELLLSHTVDAYAADDILLYGLKRKSESGDRPAETDTLQVTGRFLSYDLYGLVVPQNDSRFRWVVNRRLSQLFRSGRIGRIYEHWFGPIDAPPSPLFRSAITLQAVPLGQASPR